jgi:foldase protein PrsA
MMRTTVAAVALVAAISLLAACGGDDSVPSGSVATVDGTNITDQEFNKWLAIVVKSTQPPGSGGEAVVPDPPNFTKCVAAKKKNEPKTKGQKPRSDATLKAECKREYEAARTQVMQLLITGTWLQKEAEEQGVKVSDAEAKKKAEELLKQQYPKKKDREKFLKDSGLTMGELVYQQKLTLLSEKIREKVTADAKNVSNEDVKKYYDEHQDQFSQPETRDLSIVLTRNKEEAEKAKKELDEGASFKSVAKKYSEDDVSKQQGGKLPAVSKGQLEAALDKAVFSAKKGEIVGPVKTEFGYYVFEVNKVTPGSKQSFKQAEAGAKQMLIAERQQEELNDFVKEFQEGYRDKTVCADDYKVPECKNGPPLEQQQQQQGGGQQ